MRSALLRLSPGVCGLFALACATTAAPPPPVATSPSGEPAVIAVPAGNSLLVRLHAVGVQIYGCAATKDGGFAWTFTAPRADLKDVTGAPAGRHYAGPTWEWPDGSQVVGEVVQKAPAVGTAIPWLLLKVKSSKLVTPWGPAAWIQRTDTEGGAAPATGCDGAHAGAEVEVPYTASYAFWGIRP
jgi:hypothetical protein